MDRGAYGDERPRFGRQGWPVFGTLARVHDDINTRRVKASPHAHLASLASAERELQAEGGVPAQIGPKRQAFQLRWLSGFLHFR